MSNFPNPFLSPNDGLGRSLPKAKMFFYEAGSYNLKNTYSDFELTDINPNPVIADGDGRFPEIWLDDGGYRVVLQDRYGNQIGVDKDDVYKILDFDDINQAIIDRVQWFLSNGVAVMADLPVGRTIYTAGGLVAGDGGGGHYLVVEVGGDIPMDNGYELKLLPIGTLDGSTVNSITGEESITQALNQRTFSIPSVSEFYQLTGVEGSTVTLTSWHDGLGVGGGEFYWDSARVRTDHDGFTVYSPSRQYSGGDIQAFQSEVVDPVLGCWVLVQSGPLTAEQAGARNDNSVFTTSLQRIVSAAASYSNEINLSSDIYNFDSVALPDGFKMPGRGAPVWDGVSSWGPGTLLAGTVDVSATKGAYVSDLAIDVYSEGVNAINGTSITCSGNMFDRVNTRANNHGALFEQNHSAPDYTGGGWNVMRDCNHWGGPNGLVSKMPHTFFIRCTVNDTTVQGFVFVSDNINGATTYSRAYNNYAIDCGGTGNKTIYRVYSRDHFNPGQIEDVYNGDVLPADGIYWQGGEISGCSEHGALIGDFYQPTPTIFRLKSTNVTVSKRTRITNNGFAGVNILNAGAVDVNGNIWGGNGADAGYPAGTNVVMDTFGERVSSVKMSDDSNIYIDQATGIESGVYTLPENVGTFSVQHGAVIYKTANTSGTILSTAANPMANQRMKIWIADEFTTVTIGGVVMAGKGQVIEYYWDSAGLAWVPIVSDLLTESAIGYANDQVVDFNGTGVSALALELSSNPITLTFSDMPMNDAGKTYTLRVRSADAFGKVLPSFPSNVKFSTQNPELNTINAGEEVVYEFYWTSGVFIIKSINSYVI